MPPFSAYVQEVILVHAQRGEGEMRKNVLQVWSKAGDLLAEHDEINEDPTYPAIVLRDAMQGLDWMVRRPTAGAAPSGRVEVA